MYPNFPSGLASIRRLAVALLCGLAPAIFAATLTLTVTSADSAQPLQQARVELSPGGREAMTDQFGAAVFTEVAPGDYTAKVTYLGFPDQIVTVRVTAAPQLRSGTGSCHDSRQDGFEHGIHGPSRKGGKSWDQAL